MGKCVASQILHKNVLFASSNLNNKVFIKRVSNQEVKRFVPLGRAVAVTDLHHTESRKKKINFIHTSLTKHLNSICGKAVSHRGSM